VRAAVIEAHVYRCDRCAGVVAKAPGDEFLRQLQASRQTTNDDRDSNASAESHDTLGLPLDYVGIDSYLFSLVPQVVERRASDGFRHRDRCEQRADISRAKWAHNSRRDTAI